MNALAGLGGGLSGDLVGSVGDAPIYSLSGLSAGDEPAKVSGKSTWAAVSYTNVKNSSTTNGFKGSVINVQAGTDYHFNKNAVVGLSIGSGYVNLDNVNGSAGKYNEKSFSIAPYVQMKLKDIYTLGATLGYARGDVDQTNATSLATGSSTSSMTFAAVRGGSNFKLNEKTQLVARIGGIYMSKGIGAFTDSANTVNAGTGQSKVATLSVGSEVRHTFVTDNMTIVPYLGGDFQRDFKTTTNGDNSALLVSCGVRGDATNGIFFTIDGSTQLLRDNYTSRTIGGRVGLNF